MFPRSLELTQGNFKVRLGIKHTGFQIYFKTDAFQNKRGPFVKFATSRH